MSWIGGVAIAIGLGFVYLVVTGLRAGPREVTEDVLRVAAVVHRWTREHPGEGWQGLGSHTTADGLNLEFEHDDDPQAEATLVLPGARKGSTTANRRTVRLPAEHVDFHVHTSGYVFRVRMRGTGPVVGKEVCLLMVVGPGKKPYGGRIENDDDTDAAVGGWIEIAWAEVLRVRSA